MSTSAQASGWRIARVGGVDYVVRPSLLVMGAVLAGVFGQRFADSGRQDPWLLAVGFVLGLYVSVLVHEVAHVVAARAHGLRVHSVTLHLLGGETAIEGDSHTPRQELVVAGVGPLASLAIWLACEVAVDLLLPGPTLTASQGLITTVDLVSLVGQVNLLVAIFNLIPGLPLDGGRVLRAIIWAVTGRELVGIRVAAWIGRLTAIGLVAYALTRRDDPGFTFQLLVAALVAWFLWTGASQALRVAEQSGRLDHLVARDLAKPVPAPDAAPIPADLRGTALIRAIAATPADRYAAIEPDGTVVGSFTLDDLDEAYRSTGGR